MKTSLGVADIDWDENGNPHSRLFADGYSADADPIAESRYVFIEANDLPRRFAALAPGQTFVVAETGFGTGLNFVLTHDCFCQHAPVGARLRYISFEGYPMRRADITRALGRWSSLADTSAALLHRYPPLVPGHHFCQFNRNIELQLIFDPVEQGLASLSRGALTIDAWFLDGFAPAKNPQMWSNQVFEQMGSLSGENTSLATFTAAGEVRRQLQAQGFQVARQAGFGRKREMLTARYQTPAPPTRGKPLPTWHFPSPLAQPVSAVAIIGAGIGGLTLARALNQRSVETHLFEASPAAVSGASGNPQAALFGRLSIDRGDLGDLVRACLTYASRWYENHWAELKTGQCGLLQLPRDAAEAARMQALVDQLPTDNGMLSWLDASTATEQSGVAVNSGGLWFPQSGWVSPPLLADQILALEGIRLHCGTKVRATPLNTGNWQIQDDTGRIYGEYQAVAICTGAVKQTTGIDWLPLRAVPGQLSLLDASAAAAIPLRTILCQSAYLTPAHAGRQCLGATYRIGDRGLDERESEHQENLSQLATMIPRTPPWNPIVQGGRVAVRGTTPDYMPIVGPLPDREALMQSRSLWPRSAGRGIPSQLPFVRGLYLHQGFGSRGFAYAPLCAQHLASQICAQPSPLADRIQRAIHPGRFLIREIIKETT